MNEHKNIYRILVELKEAKATELNVKLIARYNRLFQQASIKEKWIAYKSSQSNFEILLYEASGIVQGALDTNELMLCIRLFVIELVKQHHESTMFIDKVQLRQKLYRFLRRNKII